MRRKVRYLLIYLEKQDKKYKVFENLEEVSSFLSENKVIYIKLHDIFYPYE